MSEYLRITIPLFAIGALAFVWANRRASVAVRRLRWIKFATYVVIVHAVLGATIVGRPAVVGLLAIVTLVGLSEIASAARRLRTARLAAIVIATFAFISSAALLFAARATPDDVARVYVIVAVFDGFSQAGGQLIGRRKLAPETSPGKTIEGFLIGLAAASACALFLGTRRGLPPARAMAFGVGVSIVGAVGDFGASWVKRRAGLKDFSGLLPGHGGILDRFDSFLAAAAVSTLTTL